MKFNPELQKLYCEHCESTKEFEQKVNFHEYSLHEVIGNDYFYNREEAVVFNCSNCGAKIVLNEDQSSIVCPFCGTSHVQKTEELAGIKPTAIQPFLFGIKKAVEYAKNWAKKRFFAPRAFKSTLSPNNVKGVYTPAFTFDSETSSSYYGRIGKRHTRTVGSGKNKRTETYIVWRTISGNFNMNFDDVLITAGTKFDQSKLNKISPYDTNSGKVFTEQYMLGFMGYHYDRDIDSCWDEAKIVIDSNIKRGILRQYNYDVVDYINISTTHENVKYKYVLLPVYVGNFPFKKKVYNFYVNGATGKTHGKTPISFWKVFFTVLFGLAVLGGIAYLIYMGNIS